MKLPPNNGMHLTGGARRRIDAPPAGDPEWDGRVEVR
jgi:hypothetical protein